MPGSDNVITVNQNKIKLYLCLQLNKAERKKKQRRIPRVRKVGSIKSKSDKE